MTGPQIDAIGVAVSDMAVAIAFYSRLGLDFEYGLGNAAACRGCTGLIDEADARHRGDAAPDRSGMDG